MNLLFFAFKFVHYSVCIGLIFVVLLQAGKSGGMSGIFGGGGGSDQIFNAPSGMAFIKKLTIVMACIFLFTSLMLTKLSINMSMMSIVNQLSNIPVSAPVEPVGK
ncbi:preprotein translocase subunit SecG [Candidatus Endomicrobiellum devescovinae]|jgi:preprotein translocase subunit SecG|uniref:preprotein translocase subunit SecG n=1 Tax=Candidatus Endomicrobiellum devescovinae TaxID=3242322 RepID=UPI002817F099|nr:preprotein translocase subunit SecG [Endomicrobium sp.]